MKNDQKLRTRIIIDIDDNTVVRFSVKERIGGGEFKPIERPLSENAEIVAFPSSTKWWLHVAEFIRKKRLVCPARSD